MPGRRVPSPDPEPVRRPQSAPTAFHRRSTYERRTFMADVRRVAPLKKPAQASPARSAVKFKPDVSRPRPKPVPSRQEHSQVLARQLVSVKKQKRRSLRRVNFRGLALASLAAALFVFGLGVGIVQLNTNKQVKSQVKTLAAHTEAVAAAGDGSLPDNGMPSETRPTGGGWRPAADEPKRITIPSLSVDARIIKLGSKDSGEIKTPNNIFDIGWLETTAKPGENGAMFLDGHVHGPTQPGSFYGIKKLKSGDKIQIERGDGQKFTYSVVKTESYGKNDVDMVAALNTVVPGKPGLNLITCDGKYNAANGYDHRVMVFAVLD